MSYRLASCQQILMGYHNTKVNKHLIIRVVFRPIILSAGGMMKKKTADTLIRWKRVLALSIWARMMDGITVRLIESARIKYGKRFRWFCTKSSKICPSEASFPSS